MNSSVDFSQNKYINKKILDAVRLEYKSGKVSINTMLNIELCMNYTLMVEEFIHKGLLVQF